MRNAKFQYICFVFLALLLTACGGEVAQGLKQKPLAFGNLNQINILADDSLWDGPLGDTVDFYYTAAYPILPQPEPIFDLRHFTPVELQKEPVRKELRTWIIMANLSDEYSETAKMVRKDLGEERLRRAKEDPAFRSLAGRNKWAKNQLVVYLFAFSHDELVDVARRQFPVVSKLVWDADQEMLNATIYAAGRARSVEEEVQATLNATIKIPSDYVTAIKENDFMWLRKELRDRSSNLLLYKLKYSNPEQLTKNGLKAIRDSLGRRYIASDIEDTYMRVNDVDLPMLTETRKEQDSYVIEGRGIWEIVNDYMGGAFVSYLIHNPAKQELLFVDGFIHAPGVDKRDEMQYLEHILDSVDY